MGVAERQKAAGFAMLLVQIFKHAKREELVALAEKFLVKILALPFQESDTLLRKLGARLVQLAGLTFLKPKIASWRFVVINFLKIFSM